MEKVRRIGKTQKNGVETTEGFFVHIPYKGIHLPVKLEISGDKECPQNPKKINGKVVYALPGGGDHIP